MRHFDPTESSDNPHEEIVGIAQSMLDGHLDLFEGVRLILKLRPKTDDPDNDIFLPFIGIDSETDHFPIGNSWRSRCDPDYLKRMDSLREKYLLEVRDDILHSCRTMVEHFS